MVLLMSSGASLTFVKLTVASTGIVLSIPSPTLVLKLGAFSSPSSTNTTMPDVMSDSVKLVTATPVSLVNSN